MPRGVLGRDEELEAAAEFLEQLRSGPAVLVLEGLAGIGKTTLWHAASVLAAERGYAVLSARPAEPDKDLSFAGLTDLFADIDPAIFEELPAAQRRALDGAMLRGDVAGLASDPRAVFTAALGVLSRLEAQTPVAIAVDDLQWLDPPSARALQFVTRRLSEQRVGILVSTRTSDRVRADDVMSALPTGWTRRIRVGPLSLAATQLMLKGRLGRAPLRPTLLRVHRSAEGNPLFALEIAQALGPLELRPTDPLPVPSDVLALIRQRIELLPGATRRALLLTASSSQPSSALVGVEIKPAVEACLVRELADGRITFTHPLYASAVYELATSEQRRETHLALAGRVSDLDERARHAALSATGPDEAVATLVDRAAERARSRGAPEVAAELQERAIALTPPKDRRAAERRALSAAEYHFSAGAFARAPRSSQIWSLTWRIRGCGCERSASSHTFVSGKRASKRRSSS